MKFNDLCPETNNFYITSKLRLAPLSQLVHLEVFCLVRTPVRELQMSIIKYVHAFS